MRTLCEDNTQMLSLTCLTDAYGIVWGSCTVISGTTVRARQGSRKIPAERFIQDLPALSPHLT